MDLEAHVVDLYHGDTVSSFHDMAASGVVAVICKATQGVRFRDPDFKKFKERAESAGLLFLSYHFLTPDDPIAQMNWYLSQTQGTPGRVIDWEPMPSGTCATLEQAAKAAQYLHSKQGKWPIMYGSNGGQLGDALRGGRFGECPRWIARYKSAKPPSVPWDLWQYAEDGVVPGVDQPCDVSRFKGSREECKKWLQSMVL